MALIDQTTPPKPTQSVSEATFMIRLIVKQEGDSLKKQLNKINALVSKHTRSAVAADLGADASELLTIYNGMKTLAELIDATYTADNLPA